MKKNPLKWVNQKNGLIVFFAVLFSLYNAENVFSQSGPGIPNSSWVKSDVVIHRNPSDNFIIIKTKVYDYSFDGKNSHGYLESCSFEASTDGSKYFRFMSINTQRQSKSDQTFVLMHKVNGFKIRFLSNFIFPESLSLWADNDPCLARIKNEGALAEVSIGWFAERDIRYIRISGNWCADNVSKNHKINMIIYKLMSNGYFRAGKKS